MLSEITSPRRGSDPGEDRRHVRTFEVPRPKASRNYAVNLIIPATRRTQMQNMKTLSRPGIAALFLLFSLAAFLTVTSLPLAAQAAPAGASRALSLPEHGVTLQVPAGW